MAGPGTLSHVQLSGPPITGVRPLEEIVRPFAATGTGIAFCDEQGRLEISYAELAWRAASAAERLRCTGVRPGALIGTTITNDLPSVVAVLASWQCGATVVSLPPVLRQSRAWHASRFDPVLAAMGCEFLIADENPEVTGSAGAGIRRVGKASLAEPAAEPVAAADIPAPDTALIQFTSGSVGTPKGVAISSAALASHLAACLMVAQLDPATDRIASWLPLYHDFGLISMLLTGLAARAGQAIARPSGFATAPGSWLTMLWRERAVLTAAPNFGYRLAAAARYDEPLDLSSLRICLSGGERVGWQALSDFHAVAAPMGLRWEALMPCYGLAEGTVGVTLNPPDRGPLLDRSGHVSAGRPMPGTELRLPADGARGPVQMRGDCLFSGYHTAAGFEPVPAGEWYDTGDDGFAVDGELYVIGRRAEVLSLAGRNVFAEDVESVTQQVGGAGVRACAAFRHEGAAGRFGLMVELDPRQVAGSGAALEVARRIQSSVAQTLGTRPAPLLIVRLGTIPRTTSGKAQRAQCRSIYATGEVGRRVLAELN